MILILIFSIFNDTFSLRGHSRLRTDPADMFWKEICVNFSDFMLQHHDALTELLNSIAVRHSIVLSFIVLTD